MQGRALLCCISRSDARGVSVGWTLTGLQGVANRQPSTKKAGWLRLDTIRLSMHLYAIVSYASSYSPL